MATRAPVPPVDPPADPPTPPAAASSTPVNCTCPVCKSIVIFENGALTGGESSAEQTRLVERSDGMAALEGELATAKQHIAELEESAAGRDDDEDEDDEERPFI